MRIRYTVPFKRKIINDDHWEIPVQDGKLRIIDETGYAKAFELTFEKRPLKYAPQLQRPNKGEVAATITGRDHRMIFVKCQLDEEARITIKSFSMGRHNPALPLPFDMFTRAIMAAEKYDGPRFEATLVGSARKALETQEFVNSFCYSFLLIESLYGKGQFRKEGLQAALKTSHVFHIISPYQLYARRNVRFREPGKRYSTLHFIPSGTVPERPHQKSLLMLQTDELSVFSIQHFLLLLD